MKKFTAILLTLILMFALCISATAIDQIGGTTTSDEVTLTSEFASDAQYGYSIEWGSLDFKYTTGAWDSTNQVYTAGSWDKDSSSITVTNLSNAPIWATLTYTPGAAAPTGVTYNAPAPYTDAPLAAYGSPNNSKTTTVSVSGTPVLGIGDEFNVTVGTIAITVTDIDPT